MRVRVSPTAPYKCNLTSFDLYIGDYTVLRMRILFIGPTRVGDTILATSIINHYINKYKSSEFTVVTSSVSQNLFKKMPQLQNLIIINKMRFSLHWLKIWSKVFIYRWDLVIDLRSSVLSYLVITKERKIFKGNNYDHKVVQFTKFLDIKEKINPEIWFDKNDVDDAKKILPVEGPYIAIAPYSNWKSKDWALLNYEKLLQRNIFQNYTIILTGLSKDIADKEIMENLLSQKNLKVLNFFDVPLSQMGPIFSICDLFIGSDSGLMHLAASSGCKTIGLFGPTDDRVYGPWQNIVIKSKTSPHDNIDSLNISIEQVENTIKDILS